MLTSLREIHLGQQVVFCTTASYMPIDLVTLTFCNLIDFAVFWVTENMSVHNNVNNPRQSVYLKFCTTSHHYDMHVHVTEVSMTRFRDSIAKAYTLVTMAWLKKDWSLLANRSLLVNSLHRPFKCY